VPSKSPAQHRLMQAAAHTKGGFGGVPQKVGKEFVKADKGKSMKKANGGPVDDDYDAPPRTRYRPAPDARNFDSDIDYYNATRGSDDRDDDEDKTPSRVVKAEDRRAKQYRKAVGNVAKKVRDAKKSGDDAAAKKASERFSRVQLSKTLQSYAKMPAMADKARKDWSEKIGGGKPAPFKTGGKVKSCW
jgi:hypothetical protein